MAIGPGKYDIECETALKETGGKMTLLVVVDGKKGSGFSASTTQIDYMMHVPDMLETVARQIRADMMNMGGKHGIPSA